MKEYNFKTVKRELDEISYGISFGEDKGANTITKVFIRSEAIQNEDEAVCFGITGTWEREELVKVFHGLARILENFEDGITK